MAYFKCKGDSKPKKLLLADWNLNKIPSTSPWIDEINGYELSYDNTYGYTSSGTPPIYQAWIQRDGSNNMHYLKLPNSLVFNPDEHDSIRYVLDLNYVSGTYTSYTTAYRLFVLSDSWGNSSDRMIGLIWRSTSYSDGNWYIYIGLTDTYVYISDDEDFFKESIVTVELKKNDSSSTLITVYKNGIEVGSASIPLTTFGIYSLSFGSFRNSINATINRLKVKVE